MTVQQDQDEREQQEVERLPVRVLDAEMDASICGVLIHDARRAGILTVVLRKKLPKRFRQDVVDLLVEAFAALPEAAQQ